MKRRQWISREAHVLCITTGERDPEVAITRLAQTLLDEAGFSSPPFDPCILASMQGIHEVRRVPMRSAARLVPECGGLAIEVNDAHSLGKQNFSADHEVVHTLVPTYTGRLVNDVVTGTFAAASEEEFLCDVGAATLLLDPRSLGPYARDAGPSITSVLFLADLFGGSLQATARQLAKLDLWPCAFVFWEQGYRTAEHISEGQMQLLGMEHVGLPQPKFRVACSYTSPSFGHHVPWNKSVGDTSLVVQCYTSNELTFGLQLFDLGSAQVRLFCENISVPYRIHGERRQRILSLLLHENWRTKSIIAAPHYQLEIL
jgi:hypothetical protein